MSREAITNIVAKAFEQRDSLRAQLSMKMPQVKESVFNLFNEINEFA
jgi:hypothetical protein